MGGIPEQVKRLMREDLRELTPYDPAFRSTEVNLSANENTWPVSDARRAAYVAALERVALNRYPDPLARELRARIAALYGLAAEQVIVCNGADEGLFNLLLAFAGPEREVVVAPPTFEEYANFAALLAAPVRSIWRDEDTFALDEETLLEASRGAALTILCSPNNPTGDVVRPEFVRALHDATRGIVLVDEAYAEFAEPEISVVPLLSSCERLVVARTFSKAFSLAGARLGYLLASPGVVAALASVRQIYSVNAVTQALGLAALDAKDEVDKLVRAIVDERGRLVAALAALTLMLPVEPFPSEANFVLLRLPHASAVRERLASEESVLVRDFSYAKGLSGCLRVSVGTPAEDDRFLAGFARILREECAHAS